MGEKEQGVAGEIPGKPTKEQRIAAGDDAPPAGIAVSDPGVPNRLASPGSEGGAAAGDPGGPLEATNLNSSKSNVTRTAVPGSEGGASPGGEPPDSDTAIIKSKSNITNN